MTDSVTILSHSRMRLAKLWTADGGISGYDDPKNYSVRSEQVTGIVGLSALLTRLEGDSRSAVIRGRYKGDEAAAVIDPEHHKPGLTRKIKALFDDAPLHWVLIEVDKFAPTADPLQDTAAAITEYITTQLPASFQDISYHWQLSSSAGHPKSAGMLKVHLWFWLSEPATSTDLKQWAEQNKIATDKSVLNVVQFHYTAAPLTEPGVVIPVTTRSGLFEGLFGDEVALDMTRSAPTSTALVNYVDDDLLTLSATLGWTLDYGREVLFALNADSDRATWVNDLAAFHHEFHGSAEALELAVEWSQTAANFADRKDVEARWESFGRYSGGSPMTGRWLLKRKSEHQLQLKYDAKGEWANLLKDANDEFTLREKLCPRIVADSRLDDMARESLAQMLFDVFKRLGTKYPIAQCRKLVMEKRTSKGPNSAMPEWATPWVYVTDDDKFYRSDSEEWLSMQGFNAKFNRELPTDEDGAMAQSAAWSAVNDMGVPSVTRAVYLPWAPATFELNGVSCVNTYRPSSTPVEVGQLSGAGRRAVEIVLKHLDVLAGGRKEVVQTLTDWLAHNVQHPGVKVRWAPLIKGVEGDGKTILGSLLASVMGRVNVRNVSPKVLGTDFTGWAEGSAVVVLEEIKLTGHNRYDILNALKPFITNDSIEVHRKGKDTHDAINTTNYIAFTNYVDALPLTDTDRRWWIIFSPFANSAEMAAAVAGVAADLGAYFDRLHEVIHQHPAELRRWLLDHSIAESFKPNGSAPMTAEKALMIGMSSSDDEDTVRDVLDNCAGLKGITAAMFSSRCMRNQLVTQNSEISLNTTSGNRLFSKVGFTKMPKKVKWDGEAHTIWIKGHRSMEPNEIREILDATVVSAEKGSESDDLFN